MQGKEEGMSTAVQSDGWRLCPYCLDFDERKALEFISEHLGCTAGEMPAPRHPCGGDWGRGFVIGSLCERGLIFCSREEGGFRLYLCDGVSIKDGCCRLDASWKGEPRADWRWGRVPGSIRDAHRLCGLPSESCAACILHLFGDGNGGHCGGKG